jgi:poly(3-hydroxybutyrate) depolymerase
MENLMCIDTARIYALGVGTGGGMAHLLACNQYLSRLFAAYGAVAGVFGRGKPGKRPWGICEPSREVIPVIEIHGLEDRVAPYFLGEGENGKKRVIPGHWVEEWAERNGCGSFVDEEKWVESEHVGRKTWVGRYDDGGAVSETVGHGGAAIRVARRCPGVPRKLKKINQEGEGEDGQKTVVVEENEEKPKERENIRLPTEAIPDEMASVLHYQLKSYGHGWPRQQLSRQQEVVFHGEQITIPDSKRSANDTYFDTTKVVLDFFKTHTLEEKFAKRTSVDAGANGGPLSEEEMAKQVKAQYGLDHAVLGKKGDFSNEKPSAEMIDEKIREFQAAQERKKASSVKNGDDTPEERHNEL